MTSDLEEPERIEAMITVEPLHAWKKRQDLEAWEAKEECGECCGTGECPCCERDCIECDGSGVSGLKHLSDKEVENRYFREVMESIKRLCAFSSRHDFLTEAGDFIKQHGRPSPVIGWIKPSDTVH